MGVGAAQVYPIYWRPVRVKPSWPARYNQTAQLANTEFLYCFVSPPTPRSSKMKHYMPAYTLACISKSI